MTYNYDSMMTGIHAGMTFQNINLHWRTDINLIEVTKILDKVNESKFDLAMSGIIGKETKNGHAGSNDAYCKFYHFFNTTRFGSYQGLKKMYNNRIEKKVRFMGEHIIDVYISIEDLFKYGSTEENIKALYVIHREIENLTDEKKEWKRGAHEVEKYIDNIYNKALEELKNIEQQIMSNLIKNHSVARTLSYYNTKYYGNGYYATFNGGENNFYPQFGIAG